ncbi:hypothetical protein FSP39_013750 [Pinctada imbricata]|uniref:carbonic anhydrase n=1 Tax=Pinctada imbricata TaxID=66713 RepID=A0AA89CDC6_PINIB|nr:hypothetical protein FSP39_013750 [Pinctada imbricata]
MQKCFLLIVFPFSYGASLHEHKTQNEKTPPDGECAIPKDDSCKMDFSYNRDICQGPLHWESISSCYKACGNNIRQSPINIVSKKAVFLPYLPQLRFKSTNDEIPTDVANHENRAPEFKPEDGKNLQVRLQKLIDGHYRFHNLHVHIGKDNNKGSEHSVDSTFTPMEAHMVFYHDPSKGIKPPSVQLGGAYAGKNQFVVIAVFLEVGSEGFGDAPDDEECQRLLGNDVPLNDNETNEVVESDHGQETPKNVKNENKQKDRDNVPSAEVDGDTDTSIPIKDCKGQKCDNVDDASIVNKENPDGNVDDASAVGDNDKDESIPVEECKGKKCDNVDDTNIVNEENADNNGDDAKIVNDKNPGDNVENDDDKADKVPRPRPRRSTFLLRNVGMFRRIFTKRDPFKGKCKTSKAKVLSRVLECAYRNNKLKKFTHHGEDVGLHVQLNPEMVLPSSKFRHYYTYQGSLTTPPCTESVLWVVSKCHVKVSERVLEALRSIEGYEDGTKLGKYGTRRPTKENGSPPPVYKSFI